MILRFEGSIRVWRARTIGTSGTIGTNEPQERQEPEEPQDDSRQGSSAPDPPLLVRPHRGCGDQRPGDAREPARDDAVLGRRRRGTGPVLLFRSGAAAWMRGRCVAISCSARAVRRSERHARRNRTGRRGVGLVHVRPAAARSIGPVSSRHRARPRHQDAGAVTMGLPSPLSRRVARARLRSRPERQPTCAAGEQRAV